MDGRHLEVMNGRRGLLLALLVGDSRKLAVTTGLNVLFVLIVHHVERF